MVSMPASSGVVYDHGMVTMLASSAVYDHVMVSMLSSSVVDDHEW